MWDFTALVTRTSQGERRIDLTDLEDGYRHDVATVLGILAQPDHPNVISAGVVRRGVAAPTASVAETFHRLRTITRWAHSKGLSTFAVWTPNDADSLLAALRNGTHREDAESGLSPSTIRSFINALRLARTFSSALKHPLSFMPWGARKSSEIAGEAKAIENVTAPLPWETWAPLVAGAWAFVDRFSPDIIAANQAVRALPPEPRGTGGWDTFQQWHASGGVLPLATGFGRSPQPRGTPNLRLLCRTLRVNDNFLNPAHNMYKPEAAQMVADMAADPTRSTYGGLLTASVTVTHEDGRTTPWVSEVGLGEHEYLISALRGACYVIIASLTGTRDSELQDMERDAITVADGLHAITSVQTKGRVRNAEGQTRTWWAPKPVTRAVGVLGQVSPHPTHLFARSATNVGTYNPTRDIGRLIDFINDDPAHRPGRGHGLALTRIANIADTGVHATSLRRSFSVYAVTKPGAELGLGIQLGHSAWRLVSGYASDGRQRAIKHMDGARRAVLRDEAMQLITGDTPLAGTPAADILNFRAQIVTDPERAARLADQVADRLHLGLSNDCMFNPATSGCGTDGPHLTDHYCIGDDCANALFTPNHTPVITNAIERIDLALDNPRGHPDLNTRMRRDRQNLARLRRELTPAEDDD
ncbi:MAG: hypothetical protein ABIR39_21840 [Nocardioides sp.]|uniref:hypothetical protein n=1 Tax=Nocardioides sp. TaxID=35761 RepID=UPI0032676CD7